MAAPAPISPQLQLRDALFPADGDPNVATYAIIDGAACEGLLDRLDEFKPEYCCLYAGELEADVEEVAPYFIRLEHDHLFTLWLLENIKNKPWGIFCKTPSTLREMRKHFRKFLIVKGPDGNNLYFRYYDPRVLPTFISTCEPDQKKDFFGSVDAYIAVNDQEGIIRFSGNKG